MDLGAIGEQASWWQLYPDSQSCRAKHRGCQHSSQRNLWGRLVLLWPIKHVRPTLRPMRRAPLCRPPTTGLPRIRQSHWWQSRHPTPPASRVFHHRAAPASLGHRTCGAPNHLTPAVVASLNRQPAGESAHQRHVRLSSPVAFLHATRPCRVV